MILMWWSEEEVLDQRKKNHHTLILFFRIYSVSAREIAGFSALLKDISLKNLTSTELGCDNQVALTIAANLVLHERT